MRHITGRAVRTAGGMRVEVEVPDEPPAHVAGQPGGTEGDALPAETSQPAGGRATHAVGFESVNWYGTLYTFSKKQRVVIACLWHARNQGFGWVEQASLLEEAESEQGKLRDLFNQGRHPAWGTLIVKASAEGAPPGSYRLADPPAAG